MARTHRLELALFVAVAACGGAPAPTASPSAAADAGASAEAGPFVEVREDGTRPTPAGAKVFVPAGWFVQARGDGFAFEEPDRELRMTLVELDTKRAEDAVAPALARVGKKAPEKIAQSTQDEDIAGWDEVVEHVYETTLTEGRIFAVNVRRKGGRAWVMVLDGKRAAFARRGAQLRQILGGLEVAGVADEDLSKSAMIELDAPRLAALEAFIEDARKKTRVPGVAVAVVQRGKVVLEKGFGVREVGKSDPVTAKTQFLIGSVTKSLTSLLVAKLVDEGKLSWDTKVTALDPKFSTGDAEFTEKLTIGHTFCACTGMPRRDLDFVFEYAKTKPEDMIGWFAKAKPTTGFGETFQYSNQMTALGGFLAAHVAEPKKDLVAAYGSAMKAKVFAPLAMTDTTTSFALGRVGAAMPHGSSLVAEYGEPVALSPAIERFVVPVSPAGSVASTAHDMALYALLELAKGKSPDGKELVSEKNLLERRAPRVKTGSKGAYGLGLGLGELRGLSIVSHDGGTFGFASRLFLVPAQDLGIVVLTNSTASGSELMDAITERTIEVAFDGKPRAEKDVERLHARGEKEWADARKKIESLPSEVFDRVRGPHADERLGSLAIAKDAKGVPRADVGEWSSRIGYTKADGGVELLVFLDAPLVGLALRIDGRALLIEFGQEQYRFEPKR